MMGVTPEMHRLPVVETKTRKRLAPVTEMPKKRILSDEARARISAAQKKRWAKQHRAKRSVA